jgi:hypothetical protein
MGYCQGRVCGPILQQAVATAAGRGLSEVGDLHSRPLLAPAALQTIAAIAAPSGPESPPPAVHQPPGAD